MLKNILLTGGTGFIGKHLTDVLLANGFSVSILSRSERKSAPLITYYKWDLNTNYIDPEAVLKADYIIHLAGEGIADKRWTEKRKKIILESRIKPIELIYDTLKKHNKTLEAFICASAVGIYGATTSHKICIENTPAAPDFLGQTCQKWEDAMVKIDALGIRTVKLRTGVVLGKNEGFLKKVAPSFKAGFGVILGTGKQYLPWIHIEDLGQLYLKAVLDKQVQGAYNAAITDNTTNLRLSKILANLYGYSIWLPNIPTFVLELFLGEMSAVVLKGQRVSSEKIQQQGFVFEFTDLEKALRNCLN